MSLDYHRESEIAARALREAASLCRRVQQAIAPEVLEKRDKSPVTVADFGSQALVCRRLAQAFPDDPVVAEEDSAELRREDNAPLLHQVVEQVQRFNPSARPDDVCRWIDHGGAREGGRRFWTLDPIDGTKGFLRGEQYAIALALIVDGRPELGLLACPNYPARDPAASGRLFIAVRGRGTCAGPIGGPADRETVRVSGCSDLKDARICESVEAAHSSHSDAARVAEELGIAVEPVRLDSQAKYGLVAAGEAEIYLRLPTRADYREKIWDHAAGALVVTEAGGAVTDVAGKPLEFHHGRELIANRGVIATNGRLHARVLEALRKAGVSRDEG
jgi:3'(2'), 5'-bisphosphate nucleotidase